MTEVEIRVSGLNEIVRDLRAVYPELPKIIRQNNRKFAQRIVPLVRQRFEAYYPRPWSDRASTGDSASTIRATAGATRASIAIGGPKAPDMAGKEFGSDRFQQFAPWTGPGPGGKGSRGRFLYPTIRAEVPGLVDEYYESLMETLGRAFPESGLGAV